jgi:hypothetical protein
VKALLGALQAIREGDKNARILFDSQRQIQPTKGSAVRQCDLISSLSSKERTGG